MSEDYYMSGRPVFSDSATVGGIIIIAGAPDFDKFMNILESFNKLINLESFGKLIKNVKAIWTDDAKKKHTIKVSWVSNKNIVEVRSERYDLSAVGRVKLNNRLDIDAEDTHSKTAS
jgi:hypothetical protein